MRLGITSATQQACALGWSAARRLSTAPSPPGASSDRAIGGRKAKKIAVMSATPPTKRAKFNGGSWEHHLGPTYYVTGLQLTDHRLRVPLDHSGECRYRLQAPPPFADLRLFLAEPWMKATVSRLGHTRAAQQVVSFSFWGHLRPDGDVRLAASFTAPFAACP